MPQLETLISPDGGKMTRVDLVEDYFTDFLFFRRDAWASERNHDRLRTQRYLRAGLFAFVSYLNGQANRWLSTDSSLSSPGSNLSDRLTELASRFQADSPPKEELELLNTLSSRCFDLQPADQVDLFLTLSLDQVDAAECKVAAWLDDFARVTGLPGLAKMRDAGRPYIAAHGGIVEETEDDLGISDESSNPFQDRADVWDNATPERIPELDGQ